MSTIVASGQTTLSVLKEVVSQKRYYLLSDVEPSIESIGWDLSEPDFISMDKTLYYYDSVTFSDGFVENGPINISSSYEAAKKASTQATDYLVPNHETKTLQMHYSDDSPTYTDITNSSFDVHLKNENDEDVIGASFGLDSYVKSEFSKFKFNGNGVGISSNNDEYDYFQVYKTPGGESANEENLLGNIDTNTPIQYLLKHDYESFTKIYLEDNNDRYYLYSDGTICEGGFNPPPSAGLTGMSKIDGVEYKEIGVWNLSGRILTITITLCNMRHVYLYISGILNPEAMMRIKGGVRESIEVVDVLMSAETGKISDVQCYRVGQLVHLYFVYSSPNSWSNGGTRQGYIALAPLPLGIAKGIGRYSGRNFVANITPADGGGIISMQNCGNSVAANKNVSFQFTYITDDDTIYGNSSIGSGSTGGGGVSSAAVREIVESYNYLDRTIADGIYQQLPYEDSAIPDDELNAIFYLLGI